MSLFLFDFRFTYSHCQSCIQTSNMLPIHNPCYHGPRPNLRCLVSNYLFYNIASDLPTRLLVFSLYTQFAPIIRRSIQYSEHQVKVKTNVEKISHLNILALMTESSTLVCQFYSVLLTTNTVVGPTL